MRRGVRFAVAHQEGGKQCVRSMGLCARQKEGNGTGWNVAAEKETATGARANVQAHGAGLGCG